jgi:DNA-binding transcriptional LysR family regulator
MRLSNAEVARLVRDGCFEAMDALNAVLVEAAPSMSPGEEKEIRLSVAKAMSSIIDNIVNPLLRDHPELDVDEDLWETIAVARARGRFATKMRSNDQE